MATHSSILAWRIPWTVQSMGSQRVSNDRVTSIFTFTNLQIWHLDIYFFTDICATYWDCQSCFFFFSLCVRVMNLMHLYIKVTICIQYLHFQGFPGDASSKEPTCQHRRHKRCGFNSWVRKFQFAQTGLGGCIVRAHSFHRNALILYSYLKDNLDFIRYESKNYLLC